MTVSYSLTCADNLRENLQILFAYGDMKIFSHSDYAGRGPFHNTC